MEENNIIDVSKIKVISSDPEIPVHNNPILTLRPLCADFPENSIILDKTEAIKVITDISEDLEESEESCISNIPQYIEDLQAVFNPLNVEECTSDLFKDKEYTLIDNVDDLKKYLSELLMRFDTSPGNYTKSDYLFLLSLLYKSLIFLYNKEQITLGDNLKKVAYSSDHFIDFKHSVAVRGSVVNKPSETIPSVEYLNEYHVLRWEEF